ncbi:hypothetical protein ACVWWP_000774 [Bradyrhizobium sp. LM3.6]
MRPLDHVLEPVLHVVAQIVEAVFVVGAVGDVAGISRLALGIVQAVDDHAGGHAEEAVDLAHPGGVAAGEVVVDGDDVDALAGERVEIDRERRDQRLAFAGLHLGDVALVQHHAADQLDVEMALAERALGGFTDRGESGDQEVVQRFALGDLFPEVGGAGLERLVGEFRDLGLQRVDRADAGLISLHPPVVGGAEKFAGERADHAWFLCSRFNRVAAERLSPACPSTHRDAWWRRSPDCGVHPPYGWELGKSGFNGQKRSKINAIAMDATAQRYGPVRALSTAGALRLIHHFDRLFALPRPPELGECPPRSSSPLLQQKDFP